MTSSYTYSQKLWMIKFYAFEMSLNWKLCRIMKYCIYLKPVVTSLQQNVIKWTSFFSTVIKVIRLSHL